MVGKGAFNAPLENAFQLWLEYTITDDVFCFSKL